MGRRRSTEMGQGRAVDARRDAGEHMIDRPGAIHFDPATELAIRRVRRSRPAFIFPNAERESTSIEFGFVAIGVPYSRPFIQFLWPTGLDPTFSDFGFSGFSDLAIAAFLSLGQPRKSLR